MFAKSDFSEKATLLPIAADHATPELTRFVNGPWTVYMLTATSFYVSTLSVCAFAFYSLALTLNLPLQEPRFPTTLFFHPITFLATCGCWALVSFFLGRRRVWPLPSLWQWAFWFLTCSLSVLIMPIYFIEASKGGPLLQKYLEWTRPLPFYVFSLHFASCLTLLGRHALTDGISYKSRTFVSLCVMEFVYFCSMVAAILAWSHGSPSNKALSHNPFFLCMYHGVVVPFVIGALVESRQTRVPWKGRLLGSLLCQLGCFIIIRWIELTMAKQTLLQEHFEWYAVDTHLQWLGSFAFGLIFLVQGLEIALGYDIRQQN